MYPPAPKEGQIIRWTGSKIQLAIHDLLEELQRIDTKPSLQKIMDINLKYIEGNYIEKQELCKLANISSEGLEALIEKELIPNASYSINSTHEISSPLGDKIAVTEPKEFFLKSTVALIEKNKLLVDEPSRFKAQIKEEFLATLDRHVDKRYAYNNAIGEKGNIDSSKVEDAFKIEWDYYCRGIYGICTLKATGSDIVKKEIAVKKLIEFNENHADNELNGQEKEVLKSLSAQYNEVSNLFAPYQRETSSRGKYLDKILRMNDMSQLIKSQGHE